MENILGIVGTNIRAFRKELGLTQEELAEKADLQYSYIGGIERGERNISLLTLEKIANSLNVPPTLIFDPKYIEVKNIEEASKIIKINESLLMTRNLDEIKSLHEINKEIIALIDKN